MSNLTLEHKTLLKNDLNHFGIACLKIVSKNGGIVPFEMNKAQLYINGLLEEQLRGKGYVRAMVLKGRQQGCSTLIAARFYWKVIHRRGVSAFVLSHKNDTTEMLFNMTRRFHDNLPLAIKPETKQDSAKALYFGRLDSRYSVGTAGGKETGRGGTIHYMHGSEVGFWENDSQHIAGMFQAVPSGKNIEGTEIILESTANGTSNSFYRMWVEDNDFLKIFIPWFWQDEYSMGVPAGYEFTEEEIEYQKRWRLNRFQLYWRNRKIKELGDIRLFQQEYPATASEAFLANLEDSFIPVTDVSNARSRELSPHEIYGPVIIGVDPAGMGEDETAFAVRQGRAITDVFTYKGIDTMEIVGKILLAIQTYKASKVFIDSGNMGQGVVDRLKEMGWVSRGIVQGVGFGTSPIRDDKYANKRAEMWGDLKDALHDGAQIPNNDKLCLELVSPKYKIDSNGRLLLEKKEDMKKRGVKSPNIADACALCYAFPVANPDLNIFRNQSKQSVADMGYDELSW